MPELVINMQQTVAGIQTQFNSQYPFLKIEFFRQAPVSGIGNAKNKMIIHDMKLDAIHGISKIGKIKLSNQMTVNELENCFEKEYGLFVQVFRKSGKIWLETTATDNWTLEQQNEEGKYLDQHLNVDRENPQDQDIY